MLLLAGQTAQAQSLDRVDHLTYKQLKSEGIKVIKNGGGTPNGRYGGCSRYLKRISEELVERVFSKYGYQAVEWAKYIINRESGFCPGAVNHKYSNPIEQAQCIAQFIPRYHTWVNYDRCKTDPAYSVKIFEKLSRGGQNTGPWS